MRHDRIVLGQPGQMPQTVLDNLRRGDLPGRGGSFGPRQDGAADGHAVHGADVGCVNDHHETENHRVAIVAPGRRMNQRRILTQRVARDTLDDSAVVDHLAYVAKQRFAIARATAEWRASLATIELSEPGHP